MSNSRLVKVCLRLLVAPDELCIGYCTHRVISGKVRRLLFTLSYFRPDRFVQLLSVIPILNLLLYLLVSIDLVYTGLGELVPEWEQLYSTFISNCSGIETTSSFNTLQINRLLVWWSMIGYYLIFYGDKISKYQRMSNRISSLVSLIKMVSFWKISVNSCSLIRIGL